MLNIAKRRYGSISRERTDREQSSSSGFRDPVQFFLSLFLLLVPAFLASGQQPEPVKPRSRAPQTTPQPSEERMRFEDLIEKSGIKFQLKNSISPQRFSIETMLGGVAVFDYNNDGLLDIFFTNGAQIPSLEKTDPSYWNRLYRNNGDGTFTDVTEKAGIQGLGCTTMATAHLPMLQRRRVWPELCRDTGSPGRLRLDGSTTTMMASWICW